MSNITDNLINWSVKTGAQLHRKSNQVNNMIELVRNSDEDTVFAVLLLYIARQSSYSRRVIRKEAAELLAEHIQSIKTLGAQSIAVLDKYLTFVKWTIDALDDRSRDGRKVDDLESLIKVIFKEGGK